LSGGPASARPRLAARAPLLSLIVPLLASLLLPAALLAAPDAVAPAAPKAVKTPQEIVDAAPAAAWRPLDPESTLYVELPAGRVVIELAPAFAPRHVANIEALARAGYYDGLAVNRAQDGFVVQWGDPEAGHEKERPIAGAARHLPAEFARAAAGLPFHRLPDVDGYAAQVGFVDGFAVGRDPRAGLAWLLHCYGAVGAGRDLAPDSSSGAELYVVIGQAPRQLDRNITVVGRVVQGMELLSTMPRGKGAMGFYEHPEERVPLTKVRVAADVPEAERSRLEVLRTDAAIWDALAEARRNRRDPWWVRPAGHLDVCNLPVPSREIAGGR
jgi:cyclophilin family peptidyl-prolyl cis-trans isomerase